MKASILTLAVLSLAVSAMALTGKVVDGLGIPIPGVTVKLVADGAMVLTESDGSFILKPNVPVGARGADRSPIRMRLQDGVLFFTAPQSGAMSLRTLDVAGNEIASSPGLLGVEGEVQYSVFGSRSASPGLYLVQYRIGTTTGTIRVVATKHGLATGSLSVLGHPSLMRGAVIQAVDSLSFSKSGYVTRRLSVTNAEQDMGTVVLDREGSSQNPDFGIPWNPAITYGTLTDSRDGQTYRTVVIGTQTWMAENLNYRNTTGSVDTVGQWYNNSADSGAKYGRFYSWAEVMSLESTCNTSFCASKVQPIHQGLCPTGWHIPSDAEWTTLTTAVGGANVGGGHLKSTRGWNPIYASSSNGTDTYGFRALPGGHVINGSSNTVGDYGFWWSATEYYSTGAWGRYMYYYDISTKSSYYKTDGISARCLED